MFDKGYFNTDAQIENIFFEFYNALKKDKGFRSKIFLFVSRHKKRFQIDHLKDESINKWFKKQKGGFEAP
jgi:hypothetical protein